MNERLLFLFVLGGLLLASGSAPAVVIDDFESGPLSQSGEFVDVNLQQTGLPTGSVIGGERELFALYGGSLSVGGPSGALEFSYDHSYFEAANLSYSDLGDADLTVGGHDRLRLRFAETETGGQQLAIRVAAFHGLGTDDVVGASVTWRAVNVAGGALVDIPFDRFVNFADRPVDFSQLDEIAINVFGFGFGEFAIEEIATAAEPPTGDFNADGLVDAGDYQAWTNQFGAAGPFAADANADGVVNAADYTLWRDAQTGGSSAAAAAVPEPAGVTIAVLAALACGLRPTPVSRAGGW